jgi:hypothetical protein
VRGWEGGARNWNIEITVCQSLFCFSRSPFEVSSRAEDTECSECYSAYLAVFTDLSEGRLIQIVSRGT